MTVVLETMERMLYRVPSVPEQHLRPGARLILEGPHTASSSYGEPHVCPRARLQDNRRIECVTKWNPHFRSRITMRLPYGL